MNDLGKVEKLNIAVDLGFGNDLFFKPGSGEKCIVKTGLFF